LQCGAVQYAVLLGIECGAHCPGQVRALRQHQESFHQRQEAVTAALTTNGSSIRYTLRQLNSDSQCCKGLRSPLQLRGTRILKLGPVRTKTSGFTGEPASTTLRIQPNRNPGGMT